MLELGDEVLHIPEDQRFVEHLVGVVCVGHDL
jgi:hypothetical protein